MRKISILLWVVMLIMIPAACSEKTEQPENLITASYADYIDADILIGVEAGDVYGELARDLFHTNAVREYASSAEMTDALQKGEVGAILIGDSYAAQLAADGEHNDFIYHQIPKDIFVIEAAPVFHTAELQAQYNEWFRGIGGLWDEIKDRWLRGTLPVRDDVPKFEFTGENGTLRICDTGNYPPLSYYDEDGEIIGFDMEMASRFALHMGMDLEIIVMPYDGVIEHVMSGGADMSACTFAITDEREDGIIFGEPSVITQAVLIVVESN